MPSFIEHSSNMPAMVNTSLSRANHCLVMLVIMNVCLLVTCSTATSTIQHPIVLIHYHKSGHDISRRLAKELNKHFKTKFARKPTTAFRRQHNEDGCPLKSTPVWLLEHTDGLTEADFILTAPDFFCDKVEDIFPPNAQIVHLVRNPIELVISGFLYHSQSPTPESWVTSTKTGEAHPCKYNEHTLELMAKELDLDMKLLFNVIELCETLYTSSKAKDYYNAILTLPAEQGVRLEACRAIISKGLFAGGDVLRMANNVHRLQTWSSSSSSSPSSSLTKVNVKVTVMMSWTRHWTTNQSEAAGNVVNFLLHNSKSTRGSAATSTVLKHRLMHNMGNGYDHVPTVKKDETERDHEAKPSHVTQNLWTHETRTLVQRMLLDDDILGPVLKHCAMVMCGREDCTQVSIAPHH